MQAAIKFDESAFGPKPIAQFLSANDFSRALQKKSEDTEWLFLKLYRNAVTLQNTGIEICLVQTESTNAVFRSLRTHSGARSLGVEAFRCFYVHMGWLRCFTNRSICRSLADHSCLRHSSFDPSSAIVHSRNTVSSHEPETPGLRELAASWRPEENPCQSGFFSESLFFLPHACLQFPRAR